MPVTRRAEAIPCLTAVATTLFHATVKLLSVLVLGFLAICLSRHSLKACMSQGGPYERLPPPEANTYLQI